MKKQLILSGVVALLVSLGAFLVMYKIYDGSNSIQIQHLNSSPTKKVLFQQNENGEFEPVDFTRTVDKVVNSVVFIKSTYLSNNQFNNDQHQQLPDPFKDFFNDDQFQYFFGPKGNQQGPKAQFGSGSGVIINSQGYIVTNNHVIENANDIEVTLSDNRNFKAKVVGTDPSTDLALLQISAKDLPAIALVNSDDVKVGEWVLAVGNPFSLNSTITAGIVSAKARNINILKDQFAVESFIQIDAAINQGNSGGALVNLDGGLVGINTSIASPTDAYTGYGFAIPSNMVNKVIEDLLKFGEVLRGILGIMIRSVEWNLAKEKDLEVTEGVYVDNIFANSAAASAGIKQGDVILKIDNEKTSSSPVLQEIIASHRHGDKVLVSVDRKGVKKEFTVTLINRSGSTNLVKNEGNEVLNKLGCELKEIDAKTAKKFGISAGLKVNKLHAGILKRNTQIRVGFIITDADNKQIKTVDDFIKILEKADGGVMISGVYEDIPGKYYYAFGLN